jgi:1-acyl-sn-glycerol-3-phosphate acyltransferase
VFFAIFVSLCEIIKMKIIKNILGGIWATWGLITFVITFLIFFGPSMLSYLYKNFAKGQAFFITVSRVWIRIWLVLIACPFKIFGKEHFKKDKNYIVVHNHNAFLDVPLSCPFVPGGNKTIAKDSFTKVPIFGWFYKRGGVMVDRKDERSRVKSFEAMKDVLAQGMHMCIYPEGTRNRTDKPLKDFYDGAFKLAVDTKNEIIPCIIVGTTKAMPIRKGFFLKPTKLELHYLPAVSPENMDAKTLNKKVHALMLEEFLKH